MTNVVGQYMEIPKQVHWDAVCHILKYLIGTVRMSILYNKGTKLYIVFFLFFFIFLWIRK